MDTVAIFPFHRLEIGQAQDLPLQGLFLVGATLVVALDAEVRNSYIIMDFKINETLQTGQVRKTKLPFSRLVGAVSNCAYAVRLGNRTYRGAKVSIYLWYSP